jgi:hypothetical protein
MNNIIKNNISCDLSGLDALIKTNEILGCPFDGRGIEDDAVGYINLLQEAFIYLRTVNSDHESDILELIQLCKENNINTSKFTKSYNEF